MHRYATLHFLAHCVVCALNTEHGGLHQISQKNAQYTFVIINGNLISITQNIRIASKQKLTLTTKHGKNDLKLELLCLGAKKLFAIESVWMLAKFLFELRVKMYLMKLLFKWKTVNETPGFSYPKEFSLLLLRLQLIIRCKITIGQNTCRGQRLKSLVF